MGKGDRGTRRGKIYRGSHGNVRPHGPRVRADDKKVGKGATHRTGARRK